MQQVAPIVLFYNHKFTDLNQEIWIIFNIFYLQEFHSSNLCQNMFLKRRYSITNKNTEMHRCNGHNDLSMTGSSGSQITMRTMMTDYSEPGRAFLFVCSLSHCDHWFNGRLERRMSSDEAADHRGHLQELLMVIPIISMSRLVLSCFNYY